MSTPIFIDEPLIVPVTVGEVLAQATRVLGVLSRQGVSQVATPQAAALQAAQQALLAALGNDDGFVASTMQATQQQLFALYEAVKDDAVMLAALRFPSPEFLADPMQIEVVDIQKIHVTFTLNRRQMLASLSFPRAAGATAYWLHEVRHFAENPDERVEDAILETHVPLFDRVRLAPGKRILRIKSRNLSTWALSDEFIVEVPTP